MGSRAVAVRSDVEVTMPRQVRHAIRLDRLFDALSDPARLGIVVKLYRQGECTCAELDGGRPKSTMSHHFKVLRQAGLVHTRGEGVTHVNRLCHDEIEAVYPGLLHAVVAAAERDLRPNGV